MNSRCQAQAFAPHFTRGFRTCASKELLRVIVRWWNLQCTCGNHWGLQHRRAD